MDELVDQRPFFDKMRWQIKKKKKFEDLLVSFWKDYFRPTTFRSRSLCMFFKIGVLKNFTNFKRTPVLESLFNKIASQKACNFLKRY